jgi:tripartite-type tricarboxylate transporter receptor subunit TctC
MIDRRQFVSVGALLLAGLQPALAQDRPVRILVGFPPGGSADVLARALAQQLGAYASTVIVDNKPGAGGRIALELLKASPADGSVLAISPASMIVVYPHLYRRLSYQPQRDFFPVAKLASAQFVLSVGPMVPAGVRTLADFVAWCKANPQQAAYGSSGAGSVPHFTGVALGKVAGFDWTHVAYKGAAPALTDLIGGQVAANVGVISNALPHIQAGRLRALAVSGPARSALLPQVPTLAQAGLARAQAEEWFGVFLPAGAPGQTAQRLHGAVREALQSPALREVLAKAAFEPGGQESSSEFAQLLRADHERWGAVVRASGFTPED